MFWSFLTIKHIFLGLTITACPLSPDSKAYEFVEIFSAGWNERPIYSIANRSKAISVEYLRPENGDFTFNWMELVPRPILSIAGGLGTYMLCIARQNKLFLQLMQKTVSTSVPSSVLASTRAFGATALYTALPETMRLSYSVRPL